MNMMMSDYDGGEGRAGRLQGGRNKFLETC